MAQDYAKYIIIITLKKIKPLLLCKDDKDLAPVWQQRDVKDKDITLKKYSITVIEYK